MTCNSVAVLSAKIEGDTFDMIATEKGVAALIAWLSKQTGTTVTLYYKTGDQVFFNIGRSTKTPAGAYIGLVKGQGLTIQGEGVRFNERDMAKSVDQLAGLLRVQKVVDAVKLRAKSVESDETKPGGYRVLTISI